MLGQIEKLTCAKFGVCITIFVCFIAKNECARHLGLLVKILLPPPPPPLLCLYVFNYALPAILSVAKNKRYILQYLDDNGDILYEQKYIRRIKT